VVYRQTARLPREKSTGDAAARAMPQSMQAFHQLQRANPFGTDYIALDIVIGTIILGQLQQGFRCHWYCTDRHSGLAFTVRADVDQRFSGTGQVASV
jgi:hypothetical protein